MKPAPFLYHRAESLEEALGLLAEYGDEAKVLAGGQSLMPMLNFRLARPAHLVDISHLGHLDQISFENGSARIGTLARHRAFERSPDVRRRAPLLARVAASIGHPAIRNLGTFGGAIAHADPAAEWPAIAFALDATCVVKRSSGDRTIPVEALITDVLTTSLTPEEILTEVHLRVSGPSTGWSFIEISRRPGDFAVLAIVVLVQLKEDGTVDSGRIVFAGAGPIPIRARAAEEALRGSPATESAFREIGELASSETSPFSDVQATAEYRRHVAAVLCRRALVQAAERARQGAGQA